MRAQLPVNQAAQQPEGVEVTRVAGPCLSPEAGEGVDAVCWLELGLQVFKQRNDINRTNF